VVRACLYDPDVNPVYEAFAKHWGFTGLPTRPKNPKENGKQERGGGYVKDNALKGRRFDSLDELNAFLRHWNRTVARVRIHGTTRRQVFAHYEDTDKKALQPLASEPFAIFQCGTRTVHTDGHVEVSGAFYPASASAGSGRAGEMGRSSHPRLPRGGPGGRPRSGPAGRIRPPDGRLPGAQLDPARPHDEAARAVRPCGARARRWAEAAYAEREIRAMRLTQGALALVRKHPKEAVLSAAKTCLTHRLFRYRDLCRFIEIAQRAIPERRLTDVHDDIRPINEYRLEVLA
jgi:hypothetical protein